MKYLLDTNIIIFWLKNRYQIADKIAELGPANCFVSEVTVAELHYGVECSRFSCLNLRINSRKPMRSIILMGFTTSMFQYKTLRRLRAIGPKHAQVV